MPTGSDLAPTRLDVCHRCGEDLGLSYWIEDHTKPVHGPCRDWSRVPFIFDEQIRSLWRRRSNPEVARVLRWLDRARRAWPERAAYLAERGQELIRDLG